MGVYVTGSGICLQYKQEIQSTRNVTSFASTDAKLELC